LSYDLGKGEIVIAQWSIVTCHLGNFIRAERNEGGEDRGPGCDQLQVTAKFKGYQVTVNEQFASVKTNLQKVYNELKK
jgi:hypothetical protein